MSAEKKKQMGVLGLVIALVVVLFGSILFVGAVSGWFDSGKVALDAEYVCGGNCDGEYMELDAAGYQELVEARKSFVVFVDQGGCTTADKLEGFVSDYAKNEGFQAFRIMFEEMKKTSMHESVKYYPSVVLISKGKVIWWLRADSDEDAPAYNNYDAFEDWIHRHLK